MPRLTVPGAPEADIIVAEQGIHLDFHPGIGCVLLSGTNLRLLIVACLRLSVNVFSASKRGTALTGMDDRKSGEYFSLFKA